MPKAVAPKSRPYRPLSTRKRLVFGALCVFGPVLLLGLLEMILRFSGMGGYPSIINQVGPTSEGNLVITDPAGAISFFFANPERPGYNEQYSFYDPKGPNTVRVVLVGESAIKGFPQPRNLSASAFLGEMLRDIWPDKNIEVINLGTTAVASFPVMEIMTEALDYEPDLMIISTGHNEFFGTYGVASTGSAGSRPWMLRTTRFVHSLALVQGLKRVLPERGSQETRTLMEIMVGTQYVGPDDRRRQAAAHNLEHHVARMIDLCKRNNVPVIVCTQPSNERDLAPLGTDDISRLDRKKRAEFENLLVSGIDLTATEMASAIERLRAALLISPSNSRAHFFLAQALYRAGRHDEAALHFIRARDLDPLPWRAPSLSQSGIVRAANERGAAVCDLERVFREASPGGAIGWELMDDHVHPSLEGQALAARAIVETLAEGTDGLRVDPERLAALKGWEEYARRLGDNPYDRYGVAHTMRVIFGIPFMRQTNPQAFERFDRLAKEFESGWPVETVATAREWQTVNPHAGGKRPITGMIARVLMREGKFAEALELLEIARTSVPVYTSWHMEYVYFALACREKINGRLSKEDQALALEEIDRGRVLLQHGYSTSGLAERHMGRLHQLRGEFAEAIPYLLASRSRIGGFDLVAADQALIVSYAKIGDLETAIRVAENGVAHSGQFAGMYRQMLAELQSWKKDGAPAAASIRAN
jgi:tetratricopeptide (TPR) repeat protein